MQEFGLIGGIFDGATAQVSDEVVGSAMLHIYDDRGYVHCYRHMEGEGRCFDLLETIVVPISCVGHHPAWHAVCYTKRYVDDTPECWIEFPVVTSDLIPQSRQENQATMDPIRFALID